MVGTMWAMADTDERDLSRRFYKAMLSHGGDNDRDLCEWSAPALRRAVQKLRSCGVRGVTLERWVNFVHYGV